MLCEIRILTKVSLPCTVQCKPKQDHARGNRPWCQSLQALCAPVVCFPQGWVYQIAQALAKSPWLQSSCPPPSCTSIATIFIAKKLCASAGQSPGVWRLSHSSIHVRFRPWDGSQKWNGSPGIYGEVCITVLLQGVCIEHSSNQPRDLQQWAWLTKPWIWWHTSGRAVPSQDLHQVIWENK